MTDISAAQTTWSVGNVSWDTTDQDAVNTARALAMDAIEMAGSGHPGTAMSLAPVAYLLYQKIMRQDPSDPHWVGRDRFILSCGHSSFTLYSQLYLAGYGLELEDLKATRRWGSMTPGHPEHGVTPGVEVTTGPLGSGFATAVGMAMAARKERGLFDPETPNGESPFDHFIYVLCSDGDLEEGVSSEASSLAGTQALSNLIVLWDDNHISIEGDTDTAFTEDVAARYAAYGWHVQHVDFVQPDDSYLEDTAALYDAVIAAQNVTDRPSFIAIRTKIGWPAPTMAGTEAVHGAPLGADEVAATKRVMGMDPEVSFAVAPHVLERTRHPSAANIAYRENWDRAYEHWLSAEPERAELFRRLTNRELPEGWESTLPTFERDAKVATRSANGAVLNELHSVLPELWGGSADLADSNKTWIRGEGAFLPQSSADGSGPYGTNVHFGIREFAMGLALNGIALHGPTLPFGGTYLVFSDYMRAAVRLAALQQLPVTFVWSHDSIGVGEDGPTHEPIEQLSALRAIPGLNVVRPSDANEVSAVWQRILSERSGPTALALSRQNIPVLDRTDLADAQMAVRGGYILAEAQDERANVAEPAVILLASGSEVSIVLEARAILQEQGIPVRVVAMPCVEWFLAESDTYQQEVLPTDIRTRIAVEAGATQSWYRFVGLDGAVLGIDHFGASAPGPELFERYGFTPENIAFLARETLNSGKVYQP